jgi:predicted PurR-regulated permease PerM
MDNSALEILVIILSAALAIFLILAIYLTVRIIQVINHIKKITEHAEQVADRADHISDFFAKTATPVAIAKLIANLSDIIQKKRSSKKKKDKEE